VDTRAEGQKLKIKVKLPSGALKWMELEDYLEED